MQGDRGSMLLPASSSPRNTTTPMTSP